MPSNESSVPAPTASCACWSSDRLEYHKKAGELHRDLGHLTKSNIMSYLHNLIQDILYCLPLCPMASSTHIHIQTQTHTNAQAYTCTHQTCCILVSKRQCSTWHQEITLTSTRHAFDGFNFKIYIFHKIAVMSITASGQANHLQHGVKSTSG